MQRVRVESSYSIEGYYYTAQAASLLFYRRHGPLPCCVRVSTNLQSVLRWYFSSRGNLAASTHDDMIIAPVAASCHCSGGGRENTTLLWQHRVQPAHSTYPQHRQQHLWCVSYLAYDTWCVCYEVPIACCVEGLCSAVGISRVFQA